MPDLTHTLPQKPQEELTPALLASQWKKSGQFDKLRKRLLSDFLASAEKDQLINDLDTILPQMLSSAQPPLSRIPRKDRPNHILETLDKREKAANPLEQNVDKVRERLTKKGEKGSRGLGRTVERELRGCVRRYRRVGDSEIVDEDPDSQEEGGEAGEHTSEKGKCSGFRLLLPTAETLTPLWALYSVLVAAPVSIEPVSAPTTTREPSNGPSLSSIKPESSNVDPVGANLSHTVNTSTTGSVSTSVMNGGGPAPEDVEMKPAVSEETPTTLELEAKVAAGSSA
ncbi:hypothetical protein JCM3765_000643 [Sporobolomyces pararoseus]